MSNSYAEFKGEIVVNAFLHVKPDKVAQFVQWIAKLKAYVAANEPGTLEYSFSRNPIDRTEFVVWERYANVDALNAHLGSEMMNTFKAAAADLLEKPPTLLFYHGEFDDE